jgi:hypothetical protein
MSNDSKQRLHKYVKIAALKQELERLKSNFININEVYNDALTTWCYNTSDNKKAIAELKFSETEQSKIITENDFCQTKDGFQLTESDFIKVELKRFEIIEPDKLSLIENKRFEFYNDFLLTRLEQAKAINNSTDNEVTNIIDQYKSCSNVLFDSAFMKVKNDDGTQNQLHYIELSKQYYDSLKADEQKNTRIKEYKLDGMSFYLMTIFRELFKNIHAAQIGHNNKCKIGHAKLVQSVLGMKIFANDIRVIGESKPFDMIETSGYYLGVLSTFDLKMQEFGVNIKTSPLNGLFQDVINDLKELSSYERINKEVALNELRRDQPQQKKTDNSDEIKKTHPKHNPNLWNSECFELFKYVFDEYYKGTNRQLTNIWFYLKEYQSPKYVLKATKENYKIFIKGYYNKVITNFDKAEQKYPNEYNTIDDHRQNYENTLK